ncbi:YkgJ family cysteine cluster protein [Halarcobacter sp.]|uniref:YkgJ family cysteine cluster protein n=1 Tax=Halarcobacter sp. TaxID=2321133 RepID=UPI002AAC0610|nr:YkgJ family cysteine cluster protein [Halarcobacter sp.]
MFTLTTNKQLYFGNCSNCEANCCNGKNGIIFSQIILEDFKKVYERFPIVFIFGNLNYIKPVILLTNGKDYCPYLKDYKCTIYENRPTVCRLYPLSPNLDNQIYFDLNCPEIAYKKDNNNLMFKNNKLSENFHNDIFETYQDKYVKTHLEFEKLEKKDFKKIKTINNLDFYQYIGKVDSKFFKYHQDSLKNLDNLK